MRILIAFLLSLFAALVGAETPQDFAFGIPLETSGGGALYEVELPAAVYEGVVSADLGDLRVFNANGEPVPFAFLPPPAAAHEKRQALRLPYFALRGEAATGVDAIEVRVEQVRGKALLTMNAGGKPRRDARLLGYVIDASATSEALHALALELAPAVDHLLTQLRVDASDDLKHWTTLVAGAPLVRLVAGEYRLEQLRVEFPARKAKYFRVSWPPEQSLVVTGLTLELGETVIEASRRWKQVPASILVTKEKTTTEYAADLGGQFPVDRLRLRLPQANTVASIAIQSRARASDPWRPAAGTTAYRLLAGGTEVVSQDIVLAPTTNRYWLLRVDQRGGGLGDGEVELLAGWLPRRIVFAARGAAPFQLAYGRRGAQATAYPMTTLVPGYRVEDASWPAAITLGRASAGASRTLAGERVVREALDWRRWSLWASLIIAVALLAWMARRLVRQLSNPQPAKQVPADTSEP